MKKAVVFIQGNYPRTSPDEQCFDDQNKPIDICSIVGTGFLIFYPDPRAGENRGFTYIVTNKHMVRTPGPAPEHVLGGGKYFRSVIVRVNTKEPAAEGGVSFVTQDIPVTFPTGDLLAFVHPTDPHVDLALLPVSLDDTKLDFFTIGPQNFATSKVISEQHLDESNEVDFAGLFAPYVGVYKNYPVVRHGKLAMISQERIPWMPGITEELYLADVMSFGGNSGSPVFIRTGGDSQAFGNSRYFLLGVMQGFFQVDSKVSVQTAQLRGTAKENTGIAAVVPAQKILDILEGPRAVAMRDLEIARLRQSAGKITEAIDLCKSAEKSLTEYNSHTPSLIFIKVKLAELYEKNGEKFLASMERLEAKSLKSSPPGSDDDLK